MRKVSGEGGRKLAVVRVLMTAFAGAIGEVILAISAGRRLLFAVAILARDRGVRSFQRELRVLMLLQREGRRMKTLHLVAVFATVEMGHFAQASPECFPDSGYLVC